MLVDNATIKQHQREVWFNMKGQYMKESNFFAGNAVSNSLRRAILKDTIGVNIKANKH